MDSGSNGLKGGLGAVRNSLLLLGTLTLELPEFRENHAINVYFLERFPTGELLQELGSKTIAHSRG